MFGGSSKKPGLSKLLEQLRVDSAALQPWLISIRRDIHAHPELGLKEKRTSALIARELGGIPGVEGIATVARTGVTARITGTFSSAAPSRTVLIRADMDALPMLDLKPDSCEYRSQTKDVCHSCGHDVHIACLLGAAKLLASLRAHFSGTAVLIFQPAEEIAIGARLCLKAGIAGPWVKAHADSDPSSGLNSDVSSGGESDDEFRWLPEEVAPMPSDEHVAGETKVMRKPGWVYGGVLEPKVDAAIGLHVETVREVGYIGVKDGAMYSSCDDFHILIQGRGGHAGFPSGAVNPLFVASNIIVSVNAWLSRSISPFTPCVLTFCHMEAGTTSNIIPDTCIIEGTMRTHDEKLRSELIERLPMQIRMLASAFGASAIVTVRRSFSAGSNSTEVTDAFRYSGRKLLGMHKVVEVTSPAMGSEDFFEFRCGGKVPGAMFWLGGANAARGITADNHNGRFDVDEDCLQIGAAVMAGAALRLFFEKTFEGK